MDSVETDEYITSRKLNVKQKKTKCNNIIK